MLLNERYAYFGGNWNILTSGNQNPGFLANFKGRSWVGAKTYFLSSSALSTIEYVFVTELLLCV